MEGDTAIGDGFLGTDPQIIPLLRCQRFLLRIGAAGEDLRAGRELMITTPFVEGQGRTVGRQELGIQCLD